MKVVIDTNIIIDHLRGVQQATKLLEEVENGNFEGLISTITIMEILAAPKMTEQRFEAIKQLLEIFEHLPVGWSLKSFQPFYFFSEECV